MLAISLTAACSRLGRCGGLLYLHQLGVGTGASVQVAAALRLDFHILCRGDFILNRKVFVGGEAAAAILPLTYLFTVNGKGNPAGMVHFAVSVVGYLNGDGGWLPLLYLIGYSNFHGGFVGKGRCNQQHKG